MKAILMWAALAGALLLAGCRDERVDPCRPAFALVAPRFSASAATTPPQTVVTSPATLTVAPGERATFLAVASGFPSPVCRDYELTIGWSVSDTNVARVERDTGGSTVVLARAAGRTSVIATVIAQPGARAASLLQVNALVGQGAAR